MLKKWVNKQIHFLYFNHLFRDLAFSLFGIFVPIYLLNLGYSLKSVFLYFLVFTIATLLFLLLGYSISKKIGYKPLMIASIPFVIIFITMLQLMETFSFPLELLALMNAIQNSFFFLPLHGFFSRLSEENKRGTQVSNFLVFGKLARLFAPLIGGFVAVIFGFSYLFSTATLIMVFSSIPLLKLKNVKPTEKITIKRILDLSKTNKGFFFGNISEKTIGEVSGHIWPIFVFLALKDVLSIGWIGSLIAGGTIIFVISIGKFYDRKSKYLTLRIGAILFTVLWLLRYLITSDVFIFASSFLAGFLSLMIAMPFSAIFYDKAAKEKKTDSFIIFTEIPTFIGKLIIWVLAIILINSLEISFILAALASLSMIFLKFGVDKK